MPSLDPFRFLLVSIAGWMNQRQLLIIDYLREENRVLHEQLGGRGVLLETSPAVRSQKLPAYSNQGGWDSGRQAWHGGVVGCYNRLRHQPVSEREEPCHQCL